MRIIVILSLLLALSVAGTTFASNSIHIEDPYLYAQENFSYTSMGVSSYGLYGNLGYYGTFGNPVVSSKLVTYQVITNAIYGCVNITSISAHDLNTRQNIRNGTVSLQLNINIVINATNGKRYTYFLQNVIGFNTTDRTYKVEDSIINVSSTKDELSPSTIHGLGEVLTGVRTPYYFHVPLKNVNSPLWHNYTLPIGMICPIIEVNNTFGYPIAKFGFLLPNITLMYDNASFNITSKSAYLFVSPYNGTPGNSLYSAEFVFAGGGNNQKAEFESLNAHGMWIFYYANGTFVPFVSVYTFGTDSTEGVTNLEVNPSSNYASVAVGTPNLFENILLSNVNNRTFTTMTAPPPYNPSIIIAIVIILLAITIILLYLRKKAKSRNSLKQNPELD